MARSALSRGGFFGVGLGSILAEMPRAGGTIDKFGRSASYPRYSARVPPPVPDDSASTDLALRCYAPQVVAAAFVRTHSGVGDARDTLSWRLGFLETAQRYLLGVLAAEHAGIGLPANGELGKLVDKLATPSLGDVSKAIESLASELLGSGLPLVAPEFAGLFVEVLPEHGRQRTAFAASLHELIDLRNRLFHRDGKPMPDETAATRYLDEIQPTMRQLCSSLRVLRRYPLLYVQSRTDRQDGAVVLHMLRLVGTEVHPQAMEFADRAPNLPTKVPFLLSAEGNALLLAPYVMLAQNAGHGQYESRLLHSWDPISARFQYSALDGGERSPLAAGSHETTWKREDLRNPRSAAMRRAGAVSLEEARELLGRGEGSDLPKIPGFKLEGRLGTGASSTVYLAREILAGRPPGQRVAVKVLHAAVTADPVQRARLEREHQVMSGLEHPCIAKVIRYLDTPGPCLVMEYVDGEDLQSAVERRPLAVEDAVRVAEDVLGALGAAHSRGIVHRDVKPSNILVDETRRVRLIDFGIATAEQYAGQTRTLDAVGTVAFAAPEQLTRSEPVGPAADLFSLGRVIEFLVTGKLRPPGALPAGLPAGLQAVLRKATQRESAWRYQSAEQMLADLAERRRGGWGGAPIQLGDRLSDSFELHDLAGSLANIFAFRAAEIATDLHLTILVAIREHEAERALTEACQRCSEAARSALGQPRLLKTADALHFAVLSGGDPMAQLRALLAGKPPEARSKSEGDIESPARADPSPDAQNGSMVAQIGLGFEWAAAGADHPPGAVEIIRLSRGLEAALLVLHAQLASAAGTPVAPHRWQKLSRMRPDQLIQGYESLPDFRLARVRDTKLAREVEAVGQLRNLAAHGMLERPVTKNEWTRAVAAVNRVVQVIEYLVSVGAPPHALWPVVAQAPPGWCVLSGGGTKASYRWLGNLDAAMPVVGAAADWLAALEGEIGTRSTTESWRMKRTEAEAGIGRALSSMPFVGVLVPRAKAHRGGRERGADFLAHGRAGGLPLLVVQAKVDIADPKNERNLIDELWLSATAFSAPFAALSDGTSWRWFRHSGRDGLTELSDSREVEAYSMRRS